MRNRLRLLALLLIPAAAFAGTLDLGIHGTFSITVPKGWTMSSSKEEDTGFAIVLSPPGEVNAKCLLNLVFVPKDEPTGKDDVKDKVLSAADQFVDASVEKKKALRDFDMSGGATGAYCVFTDASLVGQPTKKDDFKVLAVGMVRFNDEVSASVSLLADEEKGPDFAAMLAAVSSAAVAKR